MAPATARSGGRGSGPRPVSNRTFRTTASRLTTGRSRPRTAATSTGYGYHDHEIICAVSESRGISPTVGISFVNLTTSEAVLCQIADTQTFARTCHKIHVFDPIEILYPSTAADSKLVSILRENLEPDKYGIKMREVDRKYWSENTGLDYLQQLAFPDDLQSLKLSLAGNYFATCCFAAVIRYIDLELHMTFAPQTLRVKVETSEGAMMIDISTITNLELVQNLQDTNSKHCLFGLLNETLTRMGARLLKSNLLQPSTNVEKIQLRYAAVEELGNKEEMFYTVRDALKKFVDTDRVLTALVIVPKNVNVQHQEQSVNNVIMLKTFVDSIQPVWQALAGCENEELLIIRDLCNPENYSEIDDLIKYAINDEVNYSRNTQELRNAQVFAIQAGVNTILDVARKTYSDLNKEVLAGVAELQEQTNVNLEVKYDPARQYFIRIKASELAGEQLPDAFINCIHRKGKIECQTMTLVKMNQRIKDAHNDIISMSDSSIQELIHNVRTKIQPLFRISEAIAMLDMLTAFANLYVSCEYSKPEIIETLAIKGARHPLRESIQPEKFIANDVYATQQNRFQIMTGCNMSGKSTYIRSIALIVVMAQIGCFVPAECCTFPIMHQLFSRVSTDDNIEANVSTFSSEMREMAFILRNIQFRSLVIVDELGRGTSTTDGLAIAIAISEALIESKAYVWFVTHFRDLPRILAERAGVVNLHMTVDISPDLSRMKMKYRVSDGYEEQKFYGLALARLMNLPKLLIDTATEVSKNLHARNQARKSNVRTLAVARRRKLALKLQESLVQAEDSGADGEHLRKWLQKLQEEFIVRMAAIDAEVAADEACPVTHASEGIPDDQSVTDCENNSGTVDWTQASSSLGDSDSTMNYTAGHVTPESASWVCNPTVYMKQETSVAALPSNRGELVDDPIVINDDSSSIDES